MSPALNRGLRKAGRALLQVVASGGATALVNLVLGGLSPEVATVVGFAWLVFFTFLQNTAETAGLIGTLLPSPGLVTTTKGGVVGKAVGTVDTVVDAAGGVAGDVLGTTGKLVGGIVGTAGSVFGPGEEPPMGSGGA